MVPVCARPAAGVPPAAPLLTDTARLPRQWEDFPLTADALQTLPVKEVLPAPDVVLIRRPDLPLTPAGEHLVDLMLRFAPKA